MDLDTWIALTPAERNVRRLEWTREGLSHDELYWHTLLEAASQRFEREFSDHPLIYAVHCWHWDGRPHQPTWYRTFFEPTICVCTALFPPQRIEELPDRYATFPIVQEQMEENKQTTIDIWKHLLSELLSWPESKVIDWAKQYEDGLTGRDAWFYHETACYYVAPLLIPEKVRARLQDRGTAFIHLGAEVQSAIEIDGKAPLFIPDYDWDAARQRIHTILSNAASS